MPGEHSPAPWVDLAEGNGLHAGAGEPEAEATDAGEEIENIHTRPRNTDSAHCNRFASSALRSRSSRNCRCVSVSTWTSA